MHFAYANDVALEHSHRLKLPPEHGNIYFIYVFNTIIYESNQFGMWLFQLTTFKLRLNWHPEKKCFFPDNLCFVNKVVLIISFLNLQHMKKIPLQKVGASMNINQTSAVSSDIFGHDSSTDAFNNIHIYECLYWHFMFKSFSEEPVCLSQRSKRNIILTLSHHETAHNNRISLKVWSLESEVKCDPWTRGEGEVARILWEKNDHIMQFIISVFDLRKAFSPTTELISSDAGVKWKSEC